MNRAHAHPHVLVEKPAALAPDVAVIDGVNGEQTILVKAIGADHRRGFHIAHIPHQTTTALARTGQVHQHSPIALIGWPLPMVALPLEAGPDGGGTAGNVLLGANPLHGLILLLQQGNDQVGLPGLVRGEVKMMDTAHR